MREVDQRGCHLSLFLVVASILSILLLPLARCKRLFVVARNGRTVPRSSAMGCRTGAMANFAHTAF